MKQHKGGVINVPDRTKHDIEDCFQSDIEIDEFLPISDSSYMFLTLMDRFMRKVLLGGGDAKCILRRVVGMSQMGPISPRRDGLIVVLVRYVLFGSRDVSVCKSSIEFDGACPSDEDVESLLQDVIVEIMLSDHTPLKRYL